jgi:hypothetical protein
MADGGVQQLDVAALSQRPLDRVEHPGEVTGLGGYGGDAERCTLPLVVPIDLGNGDPKRLGEV